MIFVDTWAWIALARRQDQSHAAASRQHRLLRQQGRHYVTTDFVLGELVTHLYRVADPTAAEAFIGSLLAATASGPDRLVHVSADQFSRAWGMRCKYRDKPAISFVDFTSMVVMQDLSVREVFTGDAHFRHVGLGFQLIP